MKIRKTNTFLIAGLLLAGIFQSVTVPAKMYAQTGAPISIPLSAPFRFNSTNDITTNNAYPTFFKDNDQFTFATWVNFAPNMAEKYIAKVNGVDFRIGEKRLAFGLFLKNGGYTLNGIKVDTLNGNTWKHIAFTYDGNVEKMYVDGVLVNTRTVGPKDNSNISGSIYFGGTYLKNTYYDGSLSKVWIYNTALTQPEIQGLYAASH